MDDLSTCYRNLCRFGPLVGQGWDHFKWGTIIKKILVKKCCTKQEMPSVNGHQDIVYARMCVVMTCFFIYFYSCSYKRAMGSNAVYKIYNANISASDFQDFIMNPKLIKLLVFLLILGSLPLHLSNHFVGNSWFLLC